jgi:hypothetical protein
MAIVIIAGCIANNTQQQIQPDMVPTPTPEPTFLTPNMANVTIPSVAYTKIPDLPVQWGDYTNDPIVGNWRLMSSTYPCDAVFGYGKGHVTCGFLFVSQMHSFSWERDNQTEYSLKDSDNHRALIYMGEHNDTLTSDFFPSGSYLQKVEY